MTLRNFSGVMQIVSALQSSFIYRLKVPVASLYVRVCVCVTAHVREPLVFIRIVVLSFMFRRTHGQIFLHV
jgi:hypothetical protein